MSRFANFNSDLKTRAKLQSALYYARKRRKKRLIVSEDLGADYTFNATMTVGSTGNLRGWRLGSYGAISANVWEDVSFNRIFAGGSGSSAYFSCKFAGDVQFKDYTSLWFKIGDYDFFEASFSGASYAIATLAENGPLWTYLDSEVGNDIPIIVEARS